MAQRHKKRKPKYHLTPKQITAANAQKYHVPFWILWGVAGAESTWGKGGSNLFGLTAVGEEHPNVDTSNWWQASALSAKTLSRLKHEYGTWEAALEHYSGGGYGTSHVKQLAGEQGITPQTTAQSQLQTIPVGLGEDLFGGGFGGKALENLLNPFHFQPFGGDGKSPGSAEGLEFPPGSGEHSLNPLEPVEAVVPPLIEASQQFVRLIELLTSPQFWIRASEAIGGMILIYLALKQLTGSDVPGAGTAKQYAKAAAFKRLPPKQRIK